MTVSETPTIETTTRNLKRQRRNRLLLGLAGVVAVAAVATTAYWQLYGSHFISTDNAYAAVELSQITPSVSGTVADVRVVDTQAVKKGDVLLVIDPADAKLALAQAEANLEIAKRRAKGYFANDATLAAQVSASEAEEKQAAAQLRSAQADFARAQIDLKRRKALAASGSVSGDELTRARNAYTDAEAALAAARAAEAQAKAHRSGAIGARNANKVLIAGTTPDTQPEVLLAQAKRDQAALDLQRTVIRAPVDGVVAKRQVQVGQRVRASTPLLSLVPTQKMHVDANFKEGQLQKVKVGQPVTLTADIYGDAVTYHGVVKGFSGGTGAAFSAIPAQNATGNWIKVVQRLPVRIALDPKELQQHPLRVGLSMLATIDTRNANAH